MAMERFQQRKEVPKEEIERMEYVPAGKSIAAAFLREKNYDLRAEIHRHSKNVRDYIIEGVVETLLHNIQFPTDDNSRETSKRAAEGLFQVKKDRQALKQSLDQLDHLFKYYGRSYDQAYQNFKEAFGARLSASQKSLEKQTGMKVKIDPEKHPAFREEWLGMVGQLNMQFEKILFEEKEKIKGIK